MWSRGEQILHRCVQEENRSFANVFKRRVDPLQMSSKGDQILHRCVQEESRSFTYVFKRRAGLS
jgi:transposase-like protein